PGHVYVFQPAIGFVNTVLGIIAWIVGIGVVSKKLVIHDFIGMGAANREGVSHHGPLGLAEETEHFTHIVNKTRQYKPIRMSVRPDGFGGLKQMLKLIQVDV